MNQLKNLKKDIKIKILTTQGEQLISHLTYNGLLKLLSKSRKQESINLCNTLGIEINSKHYTCIESDTIHCIMEAFEGEHMMTQYKVDNYKIDLYFKDYNLSVECDEYHHKIDEDIIRQNYIEEKLKCSFIRYKPYEKEFNIFKLINDIYKFISAKQLE